MKPGRVAAVIIAVLAALAVIAAVWGLGLGRDEPWEVSPAFYPPVHSMTAAPVPTATPEPVTVVRIATMSAVRPSLGDDVDPEPTPEPTPTPWAMRTSSEEIELIARTIWGEAEGISSTTERAAVAWCILNRVDSSTFPDTITAVVTAPMQFHGYTARRYGECPEEFLELAADVVERWEREHAGETDVGRVLPAEYIYFEGDMSHNYYRTSWNGGSRWWWEAESPYEE